jgi:hypothetical protein
MTNTNRSDILVIRSLATQFDQGQLECCLQQQITNSTNECFQHKDNEGVINALAKAGFIKKLVAKGMPISEAMRELGVRMRALLN